jgi:hypothetical protein
MFENISIFIHVHTHTQIYTFIPWFHNFARIIAGYGINQDADDQYTLMQFSVNITET